MFNKYFAHTAIIGTTLALDNFYDVEKSLITAACMRQTEEIGVDTSLYVRSSSNLNHVQRKLKEKSLFMRTTEVQVCAKENHIHGIRFTLQYDHKRDSYLEELVKGLFESNDHETEKFQNLWLGSKVGDCSSLELPTGLSITKIRVRHDEVIRSIAFEKSDDTWSLFGASAEETEGTHLQTFELQPEDRIVGVYGSLLADDKDEEKKFKATKHFTSLGFVVNGCDLADLTSIAQDLTFNRPIYEDLYLDDSEHVGFSLASDHYAPKVKNDNAADIRSIVQEILGEQAEATSQQVTSVAAMEQMMKNVLESHMVEETTTHQQDELLHKSREQPNAFMVVSIVLLMMLAVTCAYTCLKNRGQICMKENKARQSDIASLERETPTARKLVPQDSNRVETQNQFATNAPLTDCDFKDVDIKNAFSHGRTPSAAPMNLRVDNEDVKEARNDMKA